MPDSTLIKEGEHTVSVGDSVTLITDGRGLAWGTDAYLLAAYLRRSKRMCELGAGCGVISLLCAAHGKCENITAVEIREDSADKCRRSVAYNGLEGKIKVVCRDIRDIKYTDSDMDGRFSAVFANPPYIAHPGKKNEDAAADDARHENYGGILDFCKAAARLLDYKGSFFCVFRPERLCDLFSALREAGLEPKRMTVVYPDTESRPSLVLCEAVLGGAPHLGVSAPLIFYNNSKNVTPRQMSKAAEEIYGSCDFGNFLKTQ